MILSGQTIRDMRIIDPMVERSVHNKTGMSFGLSVAGYDICVAQDQNIRPGGFCLVSSVERFIMPDNVLGVVHDKSSLARQGIAVQNTVLEPGWRGYLTLEVTNHGEEFHKLIEGQPIAQIIFHLVDQPVERLYSGKYQNQPDYPVGPLRET